MIKHILIKLSVFVIIAMIISSCSNNDTQDPGSQTLYLIDNKSSIDLRYKSYEEANESFFLLIPSDSIVQVEEAYILGISTVLPSEYFESIKLRNDENTIVYEQNPIINDSWNLDNFTYTLVITDDLIE